MIPVLPGVLFSRLLRASSFFFFVPSWPEGCFSSGARPFLCRFGSRVGESLSCPCGRRFSSWWPYVILSLSFPVVFFASPFSFSPDGPNGSPRFIKVRRDFVLFFRPRSVRAYSHLFPYASRRGPLLCVPTFSLRNSTETLS